MNSSDAENDVIFQRILNMRRVSDSTHDGYIIHTGKNGS